MATQTQYYNLDKPSYDEVADIEIINANMDKIDQQMRNNADGVNFAKGISSDAYDNSKLYAVGDYCIYDNKLYRCITAIESAEAFNIAKWEQTTVGKEVKQLNSNLVSMKNKIDLPICVNELFCFYGYWGSENKIFFQSDVNKCTNFIDIVGVDEILYTGSMGGEVATWFDENKELIGQTTLSNGTTLIDYDIMGDYLTGAKYVVLATRTLNHSTPPTIEPKVSIKINKVSRLCDMDKTFNFIGDGITDETNTLQKALSKSDIVLPCNAKILISRTIEIDSAIIKKIDGNNATIITNGDFSAFKVIGYCTGNANPNMTSVDVIERNSNTIIENVRFTSKNEKEGTAIELDGCFKTIIKNCNMYKMRNGIKVVNYNRDLIFSNNQIYALYNYGIWFTDSCNLHQLNLVGNHISYCKYCIYYDNCDEIANHQVTGNDIEVSDYPTDFKAVTRAVMIISGDSNSGQLSEFEIVGNTMQGHYTSETLVEIIGGANRNIRDMSIIGNNISNSSKNAIIFDKVKNITVEGNTHKETAGKLYKVANAENITISNNVSDQCGGLLDAVACNIDGMTLSNNIVECTNDSNVINIPSGTLNNVIISANVFDVENGRVAIMPNTVSKVVVFGNILKNGVYDMSSNVDIFNNY